MKCNHTSVGMLVRRKDETLLIERKNFPFGFAPPAGHLDEGEEFEDAARRELKEEVGLEVKSIRLLTEGRKENRCGRPEGDWHYWKIYEVEAEGDVRPQKDEVKRVDWHDSNSIAMLSKRTKSYLSGAISDSEWEKDPGIETVWLEWFNEMRTFV